MDQEKFRDWLASGVAKSAETFILEAPGERGLMPVGFVLTTRDIEQPHVLYPHVEWFPWASMRNRLEAAVSFIQGMRKEFLLIVRARERDAPFFEHLTRYGFMHCLGRCPAFFGYDLAESNTAVMFRSRKPGNVFR